MGRVRVPISDEDVNAALSSKAAKILGEESDSPPPKTPLSQRLPNIPPVFKKRLIPIVVVLLLIVGFVLIIQDRNKLQGKVDKLSSAGNTTTPDRNETEELVQQLGQFLELPTDEKPTLATISNVEQLQSQVFFKKAQNGDKVLLYSNSGKAILYRPSTKKVIEVATISTPKQP